MLKKLFPILGILVVIALALPTNYLSDENQISNQSAPMKTREDYQLKNPRLVVDMPERTESDVIVLYEGFDGTWSTTSPPTGWTIRYGTTVEASDWGRNNYSWGVGSGNASIYWSPSATEDDSLITPLIDLTGFTNVTVSCTCLYDYFGGAYTYQIRGSINGGATYPYLIYDFGTTSGVYDLTISLPWAANQDSVKILWLASGNSFNINWIALDEVRVEGDMQVADDIGVQSIVGPSGLISAGSVTPQAWVKNFGDSASVACSVKFDITPGYTNTQPVPALLAGDSTLISFSSWTATTGTYATKCSTRLPGDMYNGNDDMTGSVSVYSFIEDFESDNGNYTTPPATPANMWEWGAPIHAAGPPSAYSGTNVWGTDLDTNYVNSANWWLVSCLYIANANNPTLFYYDWFDMEGSWDGYNISYSTNGGTSWTLITPLGGYNYSSVIGLGEAGFSSSQTSWQLKTATVPVSNGQVFLLRWRFASDGSVDWYTGVYIDDVAGIDFAPLVASNDVGVHGIINPTTLVTPDDTIQPEARIKNFGTLAQSNIPVYCLIDSAGTTIYNQNVTVTGPVAADDTARVTFPDWVVGSAGNIYQVTMYTNLATDSLRFNDTLTMTSSAFLLTDTLISPFGSAPTMDGAIGTSEWNDANKYDISDVLGMEGTGNKLAGSVFLYLKHDTGFVYWGVDVPADLSFDSYDQAGFYMDEDNNQAWPPLNTYTEGNHWFVWGVATPVDTVIYRAIHGPSPSYWTRWSGTPPNGYMSSSISSGHVQIEGAVRKGTMPWWHDVRKVDEDGDTVGFYCYYQDNMATSDFLGHWPTTMPGASWNVPSAYGTLIFAPLVARRDVAVDVINAPTGTVDTMTLITPSATVHNYGEIAETFDVQFEITGPGAFVYSDTQTVSSLNPGLTTTVTFGSFQFTETGSASLMCFVSPSVAGDTSLANDTAYGTVEVIGLDPNTPWEAMADVPAAPSGKNPKSGSCLQGLDATGLLYFLKASNRPDFYTYDPATNTWAEKETIPKGEKGTDYADGKYPKRGAAMAAYETGKCLYVVRGNNRLGFWKYQADTLEDTILPGTWTKKATIPAGAKRCKYGTGLIVVVRGGKNYLFLMKGAKTSEFYLYDIEADTWGQTSSPPVGASGKSGYKKGSIMAYDGSNYAYVLQGYYGSFFKYHVESDSWTQLSQYNYKLMRNRDGKKKKFKDGAAMVYLNDICYCLKGGNTRELWTYTVASDSWDQMDPEAIWDIPLGPTGRKKVKDGGSMTKFGPFFYMTKGKNTPEFYRHVAPTAAPATFASVKPTNEGIMGKKVNLGDFNLTIAPNPTVNVAAVRYNLPKAGPVTFKVYNVTGALVKSHTIAEPTKNGVFLVDKLPAGVYILRFNAGDIRVSRKIVLER